MNDKTGKPEAHDNTKQLALLKELGIVNPSPDGLNSALKELASRKVITEYKIKSDKT